MEIELEKLRLENFKGVKQFTLEPKGRNCVIRGENATGKTSLVDGFLWLLFGKDSQGKADFALKTLDKKGQELHNLNHIVEVLLEVQNKKPINLRKELVEKYTKKRGASRAEFTGHTTNHFVNNVPVQKKEWDQRTAEIIDEETFKLLTSPTYFNSLHWERRREILLQVCGDISQTDVIASDEALAELPDILADHTIEEYRKLVNGKKKSINDRLKEIPARIDELDKSIADTSEYDPAEIAARIAELIGQILEAQEDRTGAALRKKKADLVADLSEKKSELSRMRMDAEREANKIANDLIDDRDKSIRKKDRIKDEISQFCKKIDQAESEMKRLRKAFETEAEKEYLGPKTCPTCGQDLPEDQVKKAIETHNQAKSEKLDSINQEGLKLKDEKKENKTKRDKLRADGRGLNKYIADLEAQIEESDDHKKDLLSKVGIEESKEIEKIQAEIAQIEARIDKNGTIDTKPLEQERTEEQGKLAALEGTKMTKARIEKLKNEETDLAAEYEEMERQIFLMEKYTVAKVHMLEKKINSQFKLARFKLFEQQINEGIRETCVTLYNGVPYGAGLNTGAEINVGLDIISTLSDFYGIKAPIWIDHAESVVDILDPGSQTIKLAIKEDCPKLEVDYEN